LAEEFAKAPNPALLGAVEAPTSRGLSEPPASALGGLSNTLVLLPAVSPVKKLAWLLVLVNCANPPEAESSDLAEAFAKAANPELLGAVEPPEEFAKAANPALLDFVEPSRFG